MPRPDAGSAAEFWSRWTPWRHGERGAGNFADMMHVLRLHDLFAQFAARHLRAAPGPVAVVDLGCGAAQLAGPLERALGARGGALQRYTGVDFADPHWMPARAAREFTAQGLESRARYVHHDLAQGLPAPLELPGEATPLLFASCWGITYLDVKALRALLAQLRDVAARRRAPTLLAVNMMSDEQFDREVLTRRFLLEVVPRQAWASLRARRLEPLQAVRLALRSLPELRRFGEEVRHVARLMPVPEFLSALAAEGLSPAEIDLQALWGQTTSVAVPLPAAKA